MTRTLVRLNCEATPELAASMEPDELVVAVGSEPVRPDIPGIDRENVLNILEAHEHIKDEWGDTVIIGGGPSGIELALTLADQGNKVTVVEMSDEIAENGNSLYHAAAEIRLEEHAGRIQVLKKTRCGRITDQGVEVTGQNGDSFTIPAQKIVYCVGMRARKELAESFYGLVYDVKMIGDCVKARRINEASHEGYFAGFGM